MISRSRPDLGSISSGAIGKRRSWVAYPDLEHHGFVQSVPTEDEPPTSGNSQNAGVGLAKAARDFVMAELVTKTRTLRLRWIAYRSRLTARLGGMIAIAVAALAAIVKL